MTITNSPGNEAIEFVVHNPHVNQRDVHYRNRSGHVTIEGSVKTFFEKQMAQEALRNVAGIESIENQLTVGK